MTGTVETSVEEKKRTVRGLIGSGRGFAEEYGFRVTENPSNLFQLLYLSLRELLGQLPGVGDRAIDLFFREAQVIWEELAPFADRQALAVARRMGLGRSTTDLAALAGRPGSERFAWLVGALTRVAVEDGRDRSVD